MARQLLKLRQVPDDELAEIHALLDEHEIEYYETSAGNWGISMPALWLKHNEQYAEARALLDVYSEERYRRVRGEYEELKKTGRHRTFLDIVRENPFRVVLYLAVVGALLYFSIVPFISIMQA